MFILFGINLKTNFCTININDKNTLQNVNYEKVPLIEPFHINMLIRTFS